MPTVGWVNQHPCWWGQTWHTEERWSCRHIWAWHVVQGFRLPFSIWSHIIPSLKAAIYIIYMIWRMCHSLNLKPYMFWKPRHMATAKMTFSYTIVPTIQAHRLPSAHACMNIICLTCNIFQMNTYPHPNLTHVRPITLDSQSAGMECVAIYLGVSQRLEYIGGPEG